MGQQVPAGTKRRGPPSLFCRTALVGYLLVGCAYLEARRQYAGSLARSQNAPRVTNSIGMELVRIPPGTFRMGSTPETIERLYGPYRRAEEARRGGTRMGIRDRLGMEMPHHTVSLTSPFYVGACEVTQKQFLEVMEFNPSHFRHDASLPVHHLNWWTAVEFCNRLSRREGRMPYYELHRDAGRMPPLDTRVSITGSDGYRLPTEAEWEYVATIGGADRDPEGPGESSISGGTWRARGDGGGPQPVGREPPNRWGLFDTLGNVDELCQDRFVAWPRDLGHRTNPMVVIDEAVEIGFRDVMPGDYGLTIFHPRFRNFGAVVRGGHFASHDLDRRPSARYWSGSTIGYTGFRVAVGRPERQRTFVDWLLD